MSNSSVFMLLKLGYRLLLLMSLAVFSSGCLAIRPSASINLTNGLVVESLSSNAALSYTVPGRSISGSGILMYRKPDQFRAVILSPFGSVLQEVYVSGELVTIIDAGSGIAFSGNCLDLPDKGDFSAWRYIHWIVEIDRPDYLLKDKVIARVNKFGQPENAIFENGLLISKNTEVGGQVKYGKYTTVKGTLLPLDIWYETVAKEKFSIILEDPEVNVPFEESAFKPDLSKYRVYPLSRLK